MQKWIARGYKAGKVAKQSVTLGTVENPMVAQRDACEQIGAKFNISMGAAGGGGVCQDTVCHAGNELLHHQTHPARAIIRLPLSEASIMSGPMSARLQRICPTFQAGTYAWHPARALHLIGAKGVSEEGCIGIASTQSK